MSDASSVLGRPLAGEGAESCGSDRPQTRRPRASDARTHRAVLALISLGILLFALRPRELWGVDESIVGTIVREMLVDGHWLVPHVNGEVYADKPPLYYWLAALPVAASGTLTPLWFRLPAALSAIGCLWLTYALGTRLAGRATALVAAVVLATSPLYVVSAQLARMDMLLTLLITASLYCFVRGLQEPARRRRWFLAIYPLAGLAFLAKGLIGPVVVAAVIGGVALWQRDWRLVLRLEPGWGALLAGLVILPWLVPAAREAGLAYVHDLIVRQSFGRAIHSFAHDRPFYYYLYAFPPTFLPWVFYLPGALVLLWRRWNRSDWRLGLLMSWTAGLFLLFSTVSGKLVVYLLPLLPAAALMVAIVWSEALAAPDDEPFARRWLFWPTMLAIGTFVGGAAVSSAAQLLAGIPSGLAVACAGAAALVAVILLRRTERPLAWRCFATVLATGALVVGLAIAATDTMSGAMSAKPLADILVRYSHRVPAMATYGLRPGFLNYYAERRLDTLPTLDAVRQFLAQTGPAICVVKEKELRGIWKTLPDELRVIERREVAGAAYLVIANRPVPDAS